MDLGFDPEFPLQLRLDIFGDAVKIAFAQEIGFAEQHYGWNAAFVEQAERADVLFVERHTGIDQQQGEVAGGKVGQGFRCAAARQRAEPGRIDQKNALFEAGRRNFCHGANHAAHVAWIALLGDELRELLQRNLLHASAGKGRLSPQSRSIAQLRRHRGDGIDANGQDIRVKKRIEERRLSAAYPAEERHFEIVVLQAMGERRDAGTELHQTMPGDDFFQLAQQTYVMAGMLQFFQARLQVGSELVANVPLHALDNGTQLVDYAGEFIDGAGGNRARAAHVTRLQFFNGDVNEFKVSQDRPCGWDLRLLGLHLLPGQRAQELFAKAANVIFDHARLRRRDVDDVTGKRRRRGSLVE